MAELFRGRWRRFWTRESRRSLLGGAGLFGVSLILQHYADNYVARVSGTSVGDVLLDNLPTFDMDGIFIASTLILTILIICLAFARPNYLNFGIKSASLFIIVRSISITLTHLGADPRQASFDGNNFWFQIYDFVFKTKGDYFFSGHTGIPFLMALIFWREKFWRHLFLSFSVFFAGLVIIGHIHYSIDIFAAPFMTYSIFALARHIFTRDYTLAVGRWPPPLRFMNRK